MKKRNLIYTIFFGIWALLTMAASYAATPLWAFRPLTPTTVNVSESDRAIIRYQVTNQSKKIHTLVMTPIPGITQIVTRNNCSSRFTLAYQQSCTLTLLVTKQMLQGNFFGGPVVCEHSNPLQCYQPSQVNRLTIIKDKTQNHTVGGNISGLTGAVALLNNGNPLSVILTRTDGPFTFRLPVAKGNPYQVTVRDNPLNQICTVGPNGSGIMGDDNVTNVTVTCVPNSNAHTVGGNVSGLTAGKMVLVLNHTTSINSSNGAFNFATLIAQGSAYVLTIEAQPVGQTCTIANGAGIMGTANVTNVSVNCTPNSNPRYAVGGSVSGLTSGTGTLILNGNSANLVEFSANSPFTFPTSLANGSYYEVTLSRQPSDTQTCRVMNGSGTITGANVTNVSVSCVPIVNTTLSVTPRGTIPVNGPSLCTPGPVSLTVTNTGTSTAFNVSALLPSGWIGVTQTATGCAAIAPGGTCTLSFTSTTPYVAQGRIIITGDNITKPYPVTALAFTIDCYLVWAVSGLTAEVIENTDSVGSPLKWSQDLVFIPGITSDSNSPPSACNGSSDGQCNTGQIAAYYQAPYTNYAAGLCYQVTSDNSGSTALGTWYLPATCQLNGSQTELPFCESGHANVVDNLMALGFSNGLSGYYWSSSLFGQKGLAWLEYFDESYNGGYAIDNSRLFEGGAVRCARSF